MSNVAEVRHFTLDEFDQRYATLRLQATAQGEVWGVIMPQHDASCVRRAFPMPYEPQRGFGVLVHGKNNEPPA